MVFGWQYIKEPIQPKSQFRLVNRLKHLAINPYYLTFIAPVLLLLGIVLGGYYYRFLDKPVRVLLFWLLTSLIIDIISRLVGQVKLNNLILFNLLSLTEIVCFSLFYRYLIKAKWVLVLLFFGGVYVISELARINIESISSFDSYSKVVVAFLICVMALKYVYERVIQEKDVVYGTFNLVIVFYFAMEFIIFLPLSFLVNYNISIVTYLWLLRLAILTTFYALIIQFIWKNGKTQKQSQYGLL